MSFNKKFFSTGGIVASSAAAPVTNTDNFQPVLYTGNGGTQSITSLDFQPDLVWIKNRDVSNTHLFYDSIRGAGKFISSATTGQEQGNSGDLLASFDSNGFTVNNTLLGGTNPSSNANSEDFVAWCWKAGGVPTPNNNTEGSITSTVSANTDAGFSIVKYTGNNTAGATIGHGLSSAPEMIIVKNLDTTDIWTVQHSALTYTDYIDLNSINAATTNSSVWYAAPTSSVFSFGANPRGNGSGNDIIAYCFHSVDGYQKVGSYTGDGNTSGNTIYTDSNGDNTGTGAFEPRWVMIKRTDDVGDWRVFDSVRNSSNPINNFLRPNESAVETVNSSTASIDFLSNGFEPNSGSASVNALNATYIYLAIA